MCALVTGVQTCALPIWKRGETAEPRHARLDPDLADRREARRFVERPDGQVDAFAFDIIEEKRRPAIAAEPPCDMRRTMKDRRLSARPDERVAWRGDERGEQIADRLLAHAAMAEMGIVEHRARMIAHRAALAAARDLGFDAFHPLRSEEHTSELQSLMRISYAVF